MANTSSWKLSEPIEHVKTTKESTVDAIKWDVNRFPIAETRSLRIPYGDMIVIKHNEK